MEGTRLVPSMTISEDIFVSLSEISKWQLEVLCIAESTIKINSVNFLNALTASKLQVINTLEIKSYSLIRDCAIVTWRGGWEMDKIRLKIKSYPPVTKQKFISTPPHLLIILRSSLPPLLPPPTCSLLPNLRVGCLLQA